MERLKRIQELLKQKGEIDHELDQIRQQVKAEKAPSQQPKSHARKNKSILRWYIR